MHCSVASPICSAVLIINTLLRKHITPGCASPPDAHHPRMRITPGCASPPEGSSEKLIWLKTTILRCQGSFALLRCFYFSAFYNTLMRSPQLLLQILKKITIQLTIGTVSSASVLPLFFFACLHHNSTHIYLDHILVVFNFCFNFASDVAKDVVFNGAGKVPTFDLILIDASTQRPERHK